MLWRGVLRSEPDDAGIATLWPTWTTVNLASGLSTFPASRSALPQTRLHCYCRRSMATRQTESAAGASLRGDCGWYPADGKRVGLVILGCRTAKQPFPAETLVAQLQLRNVLPQLLLIRGPPLLDVHRLAVWCPGVVRGEQRGRHDPSAADNLLTRSTTPLLG